MLIKAPLHKSPYIERSLVAGAPDRPQQASLGRITEASLQVRPPGAEGAVRGREVGAHAAEGAVHGGAPG